MTDLTPEAVREALDSATDGPWRVETDPCHYDTASDVVGRNGVLHASVGGSAKWQEQEANTRLIALAPTLAAEWLAAQARIAELEAALKIRPLEWVEGRGPRFEQTACGGYEIYFTGDADRTILCFGAGKANAHFTWQFAGDVLGEKARKAAQEHHEARIHAALEGSK